MTNLELIKEIASEARETLDDYESHSISQRAKWLAENIVMLADALELYANTHWTGDPEIGMRPAQKALVECAKGWKEEWSKDL